MSHHNKHQFTVYKNVLHLINQADVGDGKKQS